MGTDSKIATLVIMRRGSYVLLGRKKSGTIGTGRLNAPGGRLEPDEAALRCAIREVEEEVGITLDPDHLQLIGIFLSYAGEKKELYQRVYVYYVGNFVGEPRETDSMVPKFVPIDSLPFGSMHEADVFWFPHAVKGQKFRGWAWYRTPAEGYIDHDLEVGDHLLLDA